MRRTYRVMVLFLLVSMLLAAPMAAAADDGTYIVVAGDTLSAIAARHSVRSYMEIVELTNARRATDASYAFIENPNLIHVGWKLAIPGAGVGPVVAPLVAKAQAVDVGVDQTSNMAALGILDLITPPEAALAARPQATIDLIEAQIPAMYNTMVNTLKGLGSYTLFMPVGTAWTRLSDAELQTLAGDEAVRTAAWRHHVVPGTFAANQLLDGTFLTTLDGRTLAVTRVGEQVRIDGLPVVRADIDPPAGVLASKGLVHVLDGMLSPTGVVAPGPAGSYTVVKGDTLFYIAQRLLGEGRRYMEIVELTNKSGGGYAFIENPNLIEIGWMLAIPAR